MDSFDKFNNTKMRELHNYIELLKNQDLEDTDHDCSNNNDFENDCSDNVCDIKNHNFDSKKYDEFYTLVNYALTYILSNVYLVANNKKNIPTDTEKPYTKEEIFQLLKVQLEYYWNLNDKSQMIKDIDKLLDMQIITHKICLFRFLRGMSMYVVENIEKMNIENKDDDNMSKLIFALLEISKISSLEDEDDLDCTNCGQCDNAKFTDFWD